MSNFVLLVFLALRNTPLAPLSGRSYEKLRPLHKVAGYTCILSAVIHGIVFLREAADAKVLFYFSKKKDLVGALAGLLMIIIGLSTIGRFARKYYEGKGHSCQERSKNSNFFYSLLYYTRYTIHGHSDSRRNASAQVLHFDISCHHLHCMHVVCRSSYAIVETFILLFRKLCNSYAHAGWCCPSQTSTEYTV